MRFQLAYGIAEKPPSLAKQWGVFPTTIGPDLSGSCWRGFDVSPDYMSIYHYIYIYEKNICVYIYTCVYVYFMSIVRNQLLFAGCWEKSIGPVA